MDVPANPARRPGLPLRWIGHGTVLFDADGLHVLTDPVLRRRVGPLRRRAGPVRPDWYARVGLVLVSHLHADHLDRRSLRLLPGGHHLVVPAGAARLLRGVGAGRVSELAPGQRLTAGAVTVSAVPAAHPGHRWRAPLGAYAPPVGYLVDCSTRVYFAGDTDLYPAMADLRGRVDVALLPVGGWGLTLGPGHLDPERAARAVGLVRPAVAVPVHWGTLRPVGTARLRRDLFDLPGERFARAVAATAPGVRVRVLRPGQATTIAGHGGVGPPGGRTRP